MTDSNPKLGLYQHYKGNIYELVGIATHTESEEEMAVYKDTRADSRLWMRPIAMFMENVSHNGKKIRRFQKLNKET